MRIFNLKIPSMAAFHNIDTILFAKCSNRILSDFPLAFPLLQKYHLNKPFIFAKRNSVLLRIFTQTWKNLSKISFTSNYPFLLFSQRAQAGSFSPCCGIFPWMWVASLACNKFFEKCPRCKSDILGTCSSLCLPSRDLKIPTSLFVNLKPSNYSRKCAFVLFYSTPYANTFLSLSKSSATG